MSARPGLCGGHQVTGVPTAIANNRTPHIHSVTQVTDKTVLIRVTLLCLESLASPETPLWTHHPLRRMAKVSENAFLRQQARGATCSTGPSP
jgi:hypothetical protein